MNTIKFLYSGLLVSFKDKNALEDTVLFELWSNEMLVGVEVVTRVVKPAVTLVELLPILENGIGSRN